MGETNKVVRDDVADHGHCKEIVDLLARVGDKWTVMVVGALAQGGTLRYNELLRRVEGISQRMLTLTLKGLEQDGLVGRTVHATVPPRVDYELTTLGHGLTVPLHALYCWAVEHRQAMLDARKAYATRASKEVDSIVTRRPGLRAGQSV